MNTTRSWIRAYVPDLDVTAQEYTDAMTLTGTKVEGYVELDADLDKIIIGKIEKIEPHPDRRVQSMSAVLDTVQGRIRSAWKYTDNGIRYEIETPVQTEIILGNEKRVVGKGRYIFGE